MTMIVYKGHKLYSDFCVTDTTTVDRSDFAKMDYMSALAESMGILDPMVNKAVKLSSKGVKTLKGNVIDVDVSEGKFIDCTDGVLVNGRKPVAVAGAGLAICLCVLEGMGQLGFDEETQISLLKETVGYGLKTLEYPELDVFGEMPTKNKEMLVKSISQFDMIAVMSDCVIVRSFHYEMGQIVMDEDCYDLDDTVIIGSGLCHFINDGILDALKDGISDRALSEIMRLSRDNRQQQVLDITELYKVVSKNTTWGVSKEFKTLAC